MARSRAPVVTVALVFGLLLWAAVPAFVPGPQASLRGSQQTVLMASGAAAAAALAPAAVYAADAVDVMDSGSSVNLATVEVLMLGIVVGTVPITVLGMMVAAWLQFKKGPTLGI
ncbi:unnamed protein product [Polarella glacialis]|uniref:Uncharacterized protein n=1 Tax=Polarella glacialis TaxID=89957 RepID=A0A813IJJ3_POLGL|nr:unnamed protein product [Polarella glacialis]